MHELAETQQSVATSDTRLLVVVWHIVGLYAFIIYKERHWLIDVNTLLDRCGMVRKDSDAYRLIHLLCCFENGLYKTLV